MSGGGGGGAASPAQMDVSALMQQAQSLVDKCQPEYALKFLERAHKIEPGNVDVIDMLAEVALQAGEMDDAKRYLETSIKAEPQKNSSKYLYYAQMLEGQAAVTAYGRGVALLRNELVEAKKNGEEVLQKTIRQQIAAAHASVAELYMTDLCFADDAEARCEACVQKAMEADPKAPESWQAFTGLRLVQGQMEEARKGAANIVKAFKGRTSRAILDPDGPEAEAPPPSYQFRISTLKILIEVGDGANAMLVAKNLMLEDDDNVEIWYLSGLAHKTAGAAHYATAKVHLKAALEMLNRIVETAADKQATKAELQPKYDAVRAVLSDITPRADPAASTGASAATQDASNSR